MTNPGLSGGRAMLELAERVVKAAGPDRELDFAIYEALNPPKAANAEPVKPKHRYLYGEPYTASLDAAITLVPEGCHLQHFGDTDADNFDAQRWTAAIRARENGISWDDEARVWCATGPLAICAAALRARAADTPSVKS